MPFPAVSRRPALLAAPLALALAACAPDPAGGPPLPSLTPPATSCSAAGVAASDASALPTVCVLTSQGELVLELDDSAAPATVANFLTYVGEGFYTLTVVHRVERSPLQIFQGGDLYTDQAYYLHSRTPGHPAIALESDNGLHNVRGTIAMARTGAADSATSQFFVNVKDNPELDFVAGTGSPNGYAVFGRVISGMATVDAIGALPSFVGSPSYPELPSPMVLVYWAQRLK